MITKVKASGWKRGELDAALGAVSVVCGPNGSGKTSVLDAIRLCLYGNVPGLGKQNQSVMRGASGRKMSAEVHLDNGEVRTVILERKGESVKKTASHEFLESPIPLSVSELMGMTGDQFRALLSFGDEIIDSKDYVDDIEAEVPAHARNAVARCTVSGKGPVTSVNEWCRQIQDQVKRERSNLRESKSALANTQRLIEDSEPVPTEVLQGWKEASSQLKIKLAEKNNLLGECQENEARAINSKRNLEAAKQQLAELQHEWQRINGGIDELTKAKPSWTKEELALLESETQRLRAEADSAERKAGAPHEAIERCLSEIRLLEESVGACEELSSAKDALVELAFRLPKAKASESSDIRERADSLEEERKRKSKELQQFDSRMREFGVTSLEHAVEMARSLELECAAATKRVEQLEGEVVSYEGKSTEALRGEIEELQLQLRDVDKKITDADEYRSLVAAEESLKESVEHLEGELEDMKLVEKAAIKVQAKYLDAPVRKLNGDLDEFAEAAELDFRIRPRFEKKGNTTTLAINLQRGSSMVPIEAASGAEQILVGCAFLHAINKARRPAMPMIFVESAELDSESAARLHRGLSASASHGIQGFMTSFSSDWENAVWMGKEEVACG
jgi:DNA repair exonuclease SbcCD ATPase subunit